MFKTIEGRAGEEAMAAPGGTRGSGGGGSAAPLHRSRQRITARITSPPLCRAEPPRSSGERCQSCIHPRIHPPNRTEAEKEAIWSHVNPPLPALPKILPS